MMQTSYGILIGISKGLGLQYRASLLSTISYFAISLVLAEFLGSPYIYKYFNLDKKFHFLTKLHGPMGCNLGFATGLLILNVTLLYMLGSTKWSSISKRMSLFHEQVQEISIRKNLYH